MDFIKIESLLVYELVWRLSDLGFNRKSKVGVIGYYKPGLAYMYID